MKRMRMFAGPNGSGKSELIKSLQRSGLPLGPVVNADRILIQLTRSGFIDLEDYGLTDLDQTTWNRSIQRINELKTRIEKIGTEPDIKIKENLLVDHSEDFNAYNAALIADFIRHRLVDRQINFSFETVMSHRNKINFMSYGGENSYKTYLYFIATNDPAINVSRVQSRQQKGGHPVAKEKIMSRYKRSLDLLMDALQIADRAYILDNSGIDNFIIFEKKNDGKGYFHVDTLPTWFDEAIGDNLSPDI